jgi:hypothetical protein
VLRVHRAAADLMISIPEKTLAVGKFLVSPFTKLTDSGAYAASVSIRSGQGNGTHDRIVRFVARFATRDDARRYAVDQGLVWLQQAGHA